MTNQTKHFILYQNDRFHAAFPSIVRLSDGDLLLAFRRARDCNWLMDGNTEFNPLAFLDHLDPRSHVCLQRFSPKLTAIGKLRTLPMDPEAGDQDPSLLVIEDNQLLLTSFSWYPFPAYIEKQLAQPIHSGGKESTGCSYLYWGSHTNMSYDAGKTWQKHHQYLPEPDGYNPDTKSLRKVAGAIRGQALAFNGQLFLASYEGNPSRCLLWHSDTSGETWAVKSIIAAETEEKILFQEPTLYCTENGEFIAFMRTQGADGRLATARSNNAGEIWSDYQIHELRGLPFHALGLSNGQVLLSYGYRHKPWGIRYRLLDQNCHNIDQTPELILRDDGVCPDLGYTWAVQLNDQQALICYYMTDKKGNRHIAASQIEIS